MSKIGIDVSSYQGTIDWSKVKAAGVEFAILKVIKKDLAADKQFERNWAGCELNGVVIQGVYNYSCATTVEDAVKAARAVLKTLAGRKIMVWLDVEDSCQKGLGTKLIDIINAYGAVIEEAGLKFGVYTGLYFYNTYIKKYGGIGYPLWIAKYGINDGQIHESSKPSVSAMVGWQYTSKGKVNGISGNVDMNIWYVECETSKEDAVVQGSVLEWQKAAVADGFTFPRYGIDGQWGSECEDVAKKAIIKKRITGYKYQNLTKIVQRAVGVTEDGKCGSGTKSAIAAYQKIHELKEDGCVGLDTWKVILGV